MQVEEKLTAQREQSESEGKALLETLKASVLWCPYTEDTVA